MTQDIQHSEPDRHAVRVEVSAGLLAPRARVSPKYLYDELGSRLFEAICELPEYYPTRTEAAIFRAHGAEMARSTGNGMVLIDLGAGNCAKAASLFPLLRPRQYVPLDISVQFLAEAVSRLAQRYPGIAMHAVGIDLAAELVLPAAVGRERRLFFYPGSSIGNFDPPEALAFLRRLRAACDASSGILIGVDLVKESAVLDAAYDDALGVTASFNRNLLLHLNRLLGADFELGRWRHRGFYHAAAGRVEMHLEALEAQTVRWEGGARHFAAGERIHTENSYKYTPAAFLALLREAGFGEARCWSDERGWFMVCHAHAI